MKLLVCLSVFLQVYFVAAELKSAGIYNRLKNLVQVGGRRSDTHNIKLLETTTNVAIGRSPPEVTTNAATTAAPVEVASTSPGTHVYRSHRHHNKRKHISSKEFCCGTPKKCHNSEEDPPTEEPLADYDDCGTVATVVYPSHIDRKHFEVTTQVPYLTVGPIDGIGFHPSTEKGSHPEICEEIYQDYIADQYSDESDTGEYIEVVRVSVTPATEVTEDDGTTTPECDPALMPWNINKNKGADGRKGSDGNPGRPGRSGRHSPRRRRLLMRQNNAA